MAFSNIFCPLYKVVFRIKLKKLMCLSGKNDRLLLLDNNFSYFCRKLKELTTLLSI